MNDFTKEELEAINKALDYCLWKVPLGVDTRPANKKVKSLIANYCKHEWRHGAADCIACTKCEKEIFYHD